MFPNAYGSIRHALLMLDDADRNRRQLRRLLGAHFDGDRDWSLRHPDTAAWLARSTSTSRSCTPATRTER